MQTNISHEIIRGIWEAWLLRAIWGKLGKMNFGIFPSEFFVQNHRIPKSGLEPKMSPAQQQVLKHTGTS